MSKASKKRTCPAAGREITAAECGAGRISRFACPADCTFNPWRLEAYGESLAINDRLDAKIFPRLAQDMAKRGERMDPPIDSEAATQEYAVDQLYRRRDGEGLTFFQRWEAQGFDGLNNDERVMFRAHAGMRVRVIEIRTARDETVSEATDLFDPQSAVLPIADGSLASMVGRFTCLLGWMYELPHYWRMHGMAVAIPPVQGVEPADVVRAVATHLGWLDTAERLEDWLNNHFARCAEALAAISPVLWEKTMEEAQLTRTVCLYRLLVSPHDFAHAVSSWPDAFSCEPDPDDQNKGFNQGWDWLERADRDEPRALAEAGAEAVRASISLGGSDVLLAIPMSRSAVAERAEFERRLGSRVAFAGERVDDLGRQTKVVKSVTPRQRELVPPSLLQHARRIKVLVSRVPVTAGMPETRSEWMSAVSRHWLDETVPALNHLTPRQAAADPVHRPALLALVKERIRDADQKRIADLSGEEEDFSPLEEDPAALARELGLVELDVPAPPGLYLPPRPLLPALPAAALTGEEMEQRLDFLKPPDSTMSGALLARFSAEADGVCEALELLRENTEDEWSPLLDVLLALAWFILFPLKPPRQLPSGEELADAVESALDRWYEQSVNLNQTVIREALESRRQPELVAVLRDQLLFVEDGTPKEFRVELGVAVDMAITLRVLVDALDAVARPEA